MSLSYTSVCQSVPLRREPQKQLLKGGGVHQLNVLQAAGSDASARVVHCAKACPCGGNPRSSS